MIKKMIMNNDKITFTKVSLPYGWLGNMSPFPIEYDGLTWRTTEALFQALRFEDKEVRELIRAEKSPMGAKMKAKLHASKMYIKPMSEIDVENMKLCLRLKINQHPHLKSLLLETDNKEIIEDIGNRSGERHLFWGAKLFDDRWIGENVMGNLWMNLRIELTSKQ